jgi:hypothetical protein
MTVKTSRSGFVLLLAVMLLAFVGALVTGLGVLAKVEAGGNIRRLRQAQARENAQLGLTLALSQLQQWTGPDQRVTATAASQPGSAHPRWTGVWDATTEEPAAATWLVSGSEFASGRPSPDAALHASTSVTMMNDTNGAVAAPLMPIRDERLGHGTPVVGHYAWWIGDEGVKAPVAAPESPWPVNEVTLSAEQERRWLQSSVRGASPPAAVDEPSFEVRAEPNAGLVMSGRVLTLEQLAFLRSTDGTSLGREAVERRTGSWTPNNRNVIADSREGGLRQDLSLRPDLLGAAFAAWADCDSHLEAVGASSDPAHAILPAYGADPLRRRHRIVVPVREGGAVFSTAPVLSFFFLQFNVRRVGGNSAPAATNAMEIRARLVVQLWNPFTSAAVPEPLRLTVAGLPDLTLIDSNGGRQTIALQQRFGSPMVITLPADDVTFPGDADDHSWLPGRIYAWRTHGRAPGSWDTEFYNRTLSVANANLWVAPAGVSYRPPASNSVMLSVTGASSQLTLELQKADGTSLATVRSPPYAAFTTTPQRANNNDEYRFGFMLRLVDPVDFAAAPAATTWLTGEASDPRALTAGEPLYRTGSGGDLPSAYVGVSGNAVFTDENRLLDRVMGRSGMSYNEDTPVFELPRQPLVSVGQLQHLQIEAARPFATGNPWAAPWRINGCPAISLFDRFFFSGLRPTSVAGGREFKMGPPPLLEIVRTKPSTHTTTTIDDLRQQPSGRSSALLLQAGSFNVNSADAAAWAAVLRNCRTAKVEVFTFLEAAAASGTAADTAIGLDGTSGASFWRFSQSAQETFRADAGYAASSTVPPTAPSVSSMANTHLYRQGRRLLSDQQVNDFATAIAAASTLRQRASGPWRGLADFVAPEPSLGGQSALEYAIAAAGLNDDVGEFSSQWLTPADVLTSLAPVLFARSDTFRIRSYGDATNPFTREVESVAWCEAVVQRLPAYFDSSEPATTLPSELSSARNRQLGRRYQIVSFRWLNRSDL